MLINCRRVIQQAKQYNRCVNMASQQQCELAAARDAADNVNDDEDACSISQTAIIHTNHAAPKQRRQISYAYCWR